MADDDRSKLTFLKKVVSEFVNDRAMVLAAALAYYAALSFGPLIILVIWIASFFGESAQQELAAQISGLIGEQGADIVDGIVENASKRPQLGNIAGLISIGVLLLSASAVFGQLQLAMNLIWDVEPKPGQGIGGWLRKRFLSFGMVGAIAFLLLVSLAVTAGIQLAMTSTGIGASGEGWLWQILSTLVALGIYVVMFATVFRVLPDVDIRWKDVWFGAFITAVLFSVGKFLIGLYLGRSSVGSAYGAAGSLVILLVWVYYSAIILFFGAEVTQVLARWRGHPIMPSEHATRID